MAVPNLSDTCKELLCSVKPILDDEQYKKMEDLAKVRMSVLDIAPNLQKQVSRTEIVYLL